MTVSRLELKCYEYVNALRDIASYVGQGIYSLDKERSRLHEQLCQLSGLSREDTFKYTSNIDLNGDRPAEELYFKLMAERGE